MHRCDFDRMPFTLCIITPWHNVINTLIFQARFGSLDLLGPKYEWLVIDSDVYEIDMFLPLLEEGDNVVIITLAPHLKYKEHFMEAVSIYIGRHFFVMYLYLFTQTQ